ncbi:MAG: Flp family type IVb pilin [Pseudomonadota bacterium]
MMSTNTKQASRKTRALPLTKRFRADESGATAIEYGLIVSLIFLAIIAAMKSVGASNNEMYTTIETEINSVVN